MDKNKIIKILNSISHNLISLEEGDLLSVSNIIDNIDILKNELKQNEFAIRLLTLLEVIYNEFLAGEIEGDYQKVVNDAMDFLQKVVKELSDESNVKQMLNDLLVSGIEQFLETNKLFLEGKTVNESLKVKSMDVLQEDNASKLDFNSEALQIFLLEANERLAAAQDYILTLENDLTNNYLLNELFRIFHTIKGECSFLKIDSLSELAHNLETLLDFLRNNEIENSTIIIDVLLSGIDLANQILAALQEQNIDLLLNINCEDLIDRIKRITETVRVYVGEILQKEKVITESDVNSILNKQKDSRYMDKFGEIAVKEEIITDVELVNALEQQNKQISKVHVIKVKASQINFLVDMIGELIITENQLNDSDKNVIQLKKISRELQKTAMQMRTTKVGNLFIKMKRIVRDLSLKLNKKIRIEIVGEDMEIDRNLVDILEEPLVHLLRNAVYHGIENEDERKKGNKNFEGLIVITGKREGNKIIISVKDDGNGLNREKILQKALNLGLIRENQIKSLTDNDIYNFIFKQSFSTVDEVNYISGRGVGMNIVKEAVSANRGKIEILTEPEIFTEIRLIFPISTAIIDGMIVKSQGVHYIIPVTQIIESLQIKKEMIHYIENKAAVINLRNEIIPVVRLDGLFHISNHSKCDNYMIGVIVENYENKKHVFLVDEIQAKKEIVVKSLGAKFKNLRGIISGTILSGGEVGYIVDIEQIIDNSIMLMNGNV